MDLSRYDLFTPIRSCVLLENEKNKAPIHLSILICVVFTLHHQVPPQLLPYTFGDDPLNTDDVAAVQCMALKGDLPMKITWYFNESPITTIENGVHVVMTSPRISQLTIEAVTAYHRGQYRCVAVNKAGQTEYSSELRVNGTHTHTRTFAALKGDAFKIPYFCEK